jgi:hypothetical protein
MLETNRERLFARHIGQRRALFARAMSTSDYRTAAAVLKDEAAMFDVYGHKSKPGPTNGPAPTAADVVAILSRQLATIDASDLPDAEKARLTATISDAFMRAHSTVNLERQLSELTTRLEAVAKKGKG